MPHRLNDGGGMPARGIGVPRLQSRYLHSGCGWKDNKILARHEPKLTEERDQKSRRANSAVVESSRAFIIVKSRGE